MSTLTPNLRAQHHRHRETCCKIIPRTSQNFVKIRNCRNFARMLVFLKKIEKGQFLHLRFCRQHEYTLLRDLNASSRSGGWICPNTKICPIMDVKLYLREGRYCIDVMIESLFRDQTAFIGTHCEWYHQIRHRDVSRNTHRERSTVHQHRETCGKG